MYHEEKRREVTVNPGGEGKVFYQPDEADDFDEDDPDEDLNIWLICVKKEKEKLLCTVLLKILPVTVWPAVYNSGGIYLPA